MSLKYIQYNIIVFFSTYVQHCSMTADNVSSFSCLAISCPANPCLAMSRPAFSRLACLLRPASQLSRAFSCGAFYVFSRPSFPVDPGNFGNCWPTFTVKFSHREARSSVCSKVVTDHHILNVSLHYLAKYLTPFRLAVASGAVLRHPVFYL